MTMYISEKLPRIGTLTHDQIDSINRKLASRMSTQDEDDSGVPTTPSQGTEVSGVCPPCGARERIGIAKPGTNQANEWSDKMGPEWGSMHANCKPADGSKQTKDNPHIEHREAGEVIDRRAVRNDN